jgi:hypothetical protein
MNDRIDEIRKRLDGCWDACYKYHKEPFDVDATDDIDWLCDELEKAQNQMVLLKAEAEGCASLLLDIQQDAIKAQAVVLRVEEWRLEAKLIADDPIFRKLNYCLHGEKDPN